MKPLASEVFSFDNRKIKLDWFEGTPDPTVRVSQVSAYCFYQGKLVLVRNKRGWNIPGGHPENGETNEQAMYRELDEEAGILRNDCKIKIIGWMKVDDPQNPGKEGKLSAQVRYLAFVDDLPEFVPDDEICERALIDIEDFGKYVSWADSPTAKAQIYTVKENLLK